MSSSQALWIIASLLVLLLAAGTFLLIPEKALSLLGKFMRVSQERLLGLSRRDIDTKPSLPGAKQAMGGESFSQFIRDLEEYPEDFGGRIIWIRFGGCLVLLMLVTAIAALLIAYR